MPNHVWSFNIKTDAGGGPVDSLTVTFPIEQNVGNKGVSAVQVGKDNVLHVAGLSVATANLVSFFMESDQPMRVRTNSESSPTQEFILGAKKALGWNNQDLPHGYANPLSGTITDLYLFNEGTATANFQASFGLSQDSVFS